MSELKREDVPVNDRWDIQSLYPTKDEWSSDFEQAKKIPENFARWQNQLSSSAERLANALDTYFQGMRVIEKIYVYAHLRHDEDLAESAFHECFEQARALYFQFDAATAFFAPELLNMDEIVLRKWMETPVLLPYKRYLEELLRTKPHTLSHSEERLMSMVKEPLGSIVQVFSMLNNVDLPDRFPEILNAEKKPQKLTHGTLHKLLESRDPRVRKDAFFGFYKEFKGVRSTMAAALSGQVKSQVFEAKARSYASAREASLFDDNVPVEVYEQLIASIHQSLPDMSRYLGLRKKALTLPKLHLYDQFAPMFDDVDMTFTWEEAEELVMEGLKPLGGEYQSLLEKAFREGWIDKYENKGKRSGAYSSGCYDSKPYILHNFNGTLQSVFTLVHELGHSIHSALTNTSQPYQSSHYKIFVAEVASTANEALFMHHLLEKTKDERKRAYLLTHYIHDFRGTMFRQTMFAEFERDIHSFVESGQALTVERLDEHYLNLSKRYLGEHFEWDEDDLNIAWEWSRIPHFYYNFYVYKYATGMAAAVALSQQILEEGDVAVERYLRFLRSGSSKDPIDLLKDAGVDLTTSGPVNSALRRFSGLVDQLEKVI